MHLDFIYPYFLLSSIWIYEISASPHELRLLNDLLVGYIPEERPVLDSSKPVVVKLSISLQQIINLNEKEETLEVSAWLKFSWYDENLRWEPLMYGNVTDIRHPAGSIWYPDVLLYNSVDSAFDSTCKVNLLNYHDDHTASVREKKFDCCVEIYEEVKFALYLKRRTLYYSFNLILPCLLIMILVILGFTVCPETCEKVGLQISVFLAIWIFLAFMNEITPQTSEAVPLLGVFFQACMILSILATSFTVYVQSYHFRNHNSHLRMGFWMRYFLLEIFPWLLGMKVPKRENNKKTIKESWRQRRRQSETKTVFDYTDGTSKFLLAMGDAMKCHFDELVFKMHATSEVKMKE
ncbi:hypothetical protein WR25_24435 isoform B [Diploscapter pachys]|uniref:Neurotransmitter-gated ion-channel ligand-binding domain-containing protein n=1 Tax=Diploscapter pachys TaxID=2018661 RepID=A0A2A2LJ18_9BILA|nr:hypothetical protein WR25_24435 isoform B [Diploscapter pachys]